MRGVQGSSLTVFGGILFLTLPALAGGTRGRAVQAPVVLEVFDSQGALVLAHVRPDVFGHVGQQGVQHGGVSGLGGEVGLEPLEHLEMVKYI